LDVEFCGPLTDKKLGTADEYVKAIAHHSQQSSAETLYPGEIYETLKRFLEQKSSDESSNFAWLVSPSSSGQQTPSDKQSLSDKHSMFDTTRNPGRSEGFSEPDPCIEALKSNIEISHPQVLFLRGHPSPNWISKIGAFCYADPELFRWFLRYRSEQGSDCYFDSAPSVMSNMFRFKFFTIGSRNRRYRSSQEEIDSLRAKTSSDLHRYRAALRGTWILDIGVSIVRDFHVLDERHCVIEQEIVISIFEIGKTWMGKTQPLERLQRTGLLMIK
jgi:hypothetical protein